ncbi:protein kinase [Fibrobacterota bacterium]
MDIVVESTLQFAPGELFAERFSIRKPMGPGSLSDAYLCRDTSQDDKELVLKIVHGRYCKRPGFVNSFTMLTRSVMQIRHDNICRVRDVRRHEEFLYYTMDFISETSFRIWLMKTLTFEERVVPGLQYLRKLAAVMDVLHEHGHYACTKPENIFIRGDDLVLSDFWPVSFISPSEFETKPAARQYLGYMAPEVRDEWSSISRAADFYSAGAILYEILTGRPPFGAYTLPSENSNYYNAETDDIVEAALAPRPEHRYGTVQELVQGIDALITTFSPKSEELTKFDAETDPAEGYSAQGETLSGTGTESGEMGASEPVETVEQPEETDGGDSLPDSGEGREEEEQRAEPEEVYNEPEAYAQQDRSPDTGGDQAEAADTESGAGEEIAEDETRLLETIGGEPADQGDSAMEQSAEKVSETPEPAAMEPEGGMGEPAVQVDEIGEKPEKESHENPPRENREDDGKESTVQEQVGVVNGPGNRTPEDDDPGGDETLDFSEEETLGTGPSDNSEADSGGMAPDLSLDDLEDFSLDSEADLQQGPIPAMNDAGGLESKDGDKGTGTIPEVVHETGEKKPEFSMDDDVEDVVPDPNLDSMENQEKAKKRSVNLRQQHTEFIPIIEPDDSDDREEASPMPVWLKISLAAAGLFIAGGAVYFGLVSTGLF